MLSPNWIQCNVATQWIRVESIVDNKKLYLKIQQSFKIVHTHQELQLKITQNINMHKIILRSLQFIVVNDLRYHTIYNIQCKNCKQILSYVVHCVRASLTGTTVAPFWAHWSAVGDWCGHWKLILYIIHSDGGPSNVVL